MKKPTRRNNSELHEYIEYQEAIIESLKEYAHHNGSCIVWNDYTECDCGLVELLTDEAKAT